jgi:hypothetical protein
MHDAQAAKRGLRAIEIVIFRIAAIYPGHAHLTCSAFASTPEHLMRATVRLYRSLTGGSTSACLPSTGLTGLLGTRSVGLVSLWRINLRQPDLHSLLRVGQGGESITVGYANGLPVNVSA